MKLPQILRILSNKSAEGLSFIGLYLELLNYVVTCVHCMRHGNPLVYVQDLCSVQSVCLAHRVLQLACSPVTRSGFKLGFRESPFITAH